MTDIYTIKTENHIFQTKIRKTSYGHFIEINGITFSGSMELLLNHTFSNVVSQVHAETKNLSTVVAMLKGALQLCKTLFNASIFEFSDYSTTCSSSVQRPLSLAHSYIIDYMKTWYEFHFNAKIKEDEQYDLYRKNLEKLKQPISLDFEKFCIKYHIEQYEALEPFYKKAKSWLDFLQSIPRLEQCNRIIDSIIDFKPSHETWIIDVNNMEPIQMIILPHEEIHTTFSNSRYLGSTEM